MIHRLLHLLLLSSIFLPSNTFPSPQPPPFTSIFQKIRGDFLALTRRSTTRHILLPKSQDVALALKQKIRNMVYEDNVFIIDAFSAAAQKYSRDEETAVRGGLLGTLVPQGYCLSPELDRACFTAPLGEVYGPIESEFGYHLVLVCERLNCPKLDGKNTRLVRSSGKDGEATEMLVPSEDARSVEEQILVGSLGQIGFWLGIGLAGGIVAELAAKAAGLLDTLPWE